MALELLIQAFKILSRTFPYLFFLIFTFTTTSSKYGNISV